MIRLGKKSPLRHTTNTMHAEPHVVKFYTKDKKEITDVDAIKELTNKWGGGDMGQLDYNGQKVKFSTIKSESVSKEELEDPNLLKDKEEKSYLDNFDVFKSTKEGNEFRAFVNQFDPEWAQTEVDYKSGKTTQLSLKGNRKNKFIVSAYKVYGEEYERFKSLPPEAQHQIYGFGDEEVDINKIKRKIPKLTYDFEIDGVQLTEDTYTVINGKSITKKEWGDGIKNRTFSEDQAKEGSLNKTKIENWKSNNESLIKETKEKYNKEYAGDIEFNNSFDEFDKNQKEYLNQEKEDIISSNIAATKIMELDLNKDEIKASLISSQERVEAWALVDDYKTGRISIEEVPGYDELTTEGLDNGYLGWESFVKAFPHADDMQSVFIDDLDPILNPMKKEDREKWLYNEGDESYVTIEMPNGELKYFNAWVDFESAFDFRQGVLKFQNSITSWKNDEYHFVEPFIEQAKFNTAAQYLREEQPDLILNEENVKERAKTVLTNDPNFVTNLEAEIDLKSKKEDFRKKVIKSIKDESGLIFGTSDEQEDFERAADALRLKLDNKSIKTLKTFETAQKHTETVKNRIKEVDNDLKISSEELKSFGDNIKSFNKEIESIENAPNIIAFNEETEKLTKEYEGDLLKALGPRFQYQWQVDLVNKSIKELEIKYNVTENDIKTYESKVSALKAEYDISDKNIKDYNASIATHKSNVETRQYLAKKLNYQQEIFRDLISEIEEIELDEEMLQVFSEEIGKDYSPGVIILTDTGVAVASTLFGIEETAYQAVTAIPDPIIDWIAGEDIDIGSLTGRDYLKKAESAMHNWRAREIGASPTWDDVVNGDANMLYYSLDLIGTQVPTIVALTLTGGTVGLSLLSAGYVGNRSIERAYESGWDGQTSFSGVYGNKYTALEWYGAMGADFIVSYTSERIMLRQFNKFNFSRKTILGQRNNILKPLKNKIFTKRNLGITVYDITEGMTQEGAAGVGENVIDKWFLGKEVSLWDNVPEQIISGGLLSTLYKTPLMFQHGINAFKSKDANQIIGENNKKVFELGKLLQKEDLSEGDFDIYQAEQIKLFKENNDLIFKDIKRVDLLSNGEKTTLVDIENKQYKLRSDATDISNSDTKTVEEKQNEISKLQEEHSNLSNQKEEILSQYSDEIIEDNYEQQETDRIVKEEKEDKNQEGIYEKIKKGVVNHQAFDESNIVISEQENDLDTREAWEMIVNQDIAYLESQLEELEIDSKEYQNVQNEISKLQSTITDIDLESSEFGKHFGFVYNSITTGQKVIIVNKYRAQKGGEGEYVISHENLHPIVSDIVHNTNFESETIAGQELFQYIKQEYNKQGHEKPFEETTFYKRLLDYEMDGPDVQASEVFTLLSDAFFTGDIPYNSNNTTFLDKIKGNVNEMLVSVGLKDLKLKTAEDLYNFVKTYNESIEKGGKGREARIIDKAIIEGKRIEREEKEARIQHSKNVQQEIIIKPDLKTDFDNLVQKPDRTKKYETKEDFQQSVDFFPAYDMIVNSKKLDGLVMANVSDVVQPAQMSEFVNKVKEKVGDRLMKNFDPGINESLFGWLTGKSGGRGESIIFRAKGDVMNEYKKEIQATSLDQESQKMVQIEAKADASLEAFENQDLTKEKVKKVKGIKLSERLGPKAQDINRFVKSKATGMDVSNLNFKKLKDLTPESTQEMFGIVPKVGNLTKQDVKNAQMFINKNAETLISMLPEGSTASGTSTGVQKVLLDAFYTKSDRVKTAKTGSKAGLAVQIKNENIKVQEFLEVFGITERGKENTYRKDSNTSSRVKALVDQTGRMMTNQAVREHLIERQESAQTIQKLSEGKADVMFSKDNATVIENTDPKGDKLFPNQELYADLDFDGGQLNIEFEHSDRSNISKVLKRHTGESLFKHDTKKEIDNYFTEFENVVISNLPQAFHGGALGSFVYNSHRMLPNRGVGKLDKLVNGKEITIKDYFKQKKDILVERHKNGELSYGMDFKGEGAKYVYGKTFGEMFGKTNVDIARKFDDGTREKFNAIHLSMHSQLWQRVNASIFADQKNAKIWANYFVSVGNNSKHPQRVGVDYVGYSPNPKGYKPGPKSAFKLYEWEHAMMATKQYVYLFDSALDKGSNFNAAYFFTQRNYKLIALDNYYDKVQIKLSGRTTSMGRVWNLETNSWDTWNLIQHSFLDRYFNPDTFAIDGGIPTSSIMGPNKKTFEEIYNINADGSPRGTIPGVKSKIQASKAINNSRAININTESRGMSAWDFDDTLATTKSGVITTIPNLDGTPQPGRKVIFLAGGAGSGKGNVISKLGLEGQGFKVVNQDISLEWLKKNSGLPADMNDLTKEQRSKLGTLQHQARGIAKRKMMKYQGDADGVVVDGTGGSINAMQGLVTEFEAKGYDVSMLFVETSLETALERNKARKERSLLDKIVIKNHEAVQGNKDGFKDMFSDRFMEVKTDNLKQEDAMPPKLVGKMNDFVSGYKKVRLDAEQFATEGADILAQGGEFDFSEFNVVTEGAQGPMFNTAMKRAKKFGTKDTYVLTARPPAAAVPIQQFLASQGLNIPIENISGLGNSTGEAKAQWMLEKFSEGYNNMFFADDVMQNVEAVKNVLDQLDIKSKVVQAKIKFSKDMKSTMDNILDGPQLTNIKNQSSINDVKNVDRLSSSGVYSNIKFSKKHRGEYESLISKNRPDLVKEGLVTQSVDQMFDLVDGLDIPISKRRKYEKIMTKWLATSVMKLPEDNYKLQQSVELAEKNNLDLFAYNNPNEIIEAYAGKSKEKPTNPDTVELFVKDESKTNDQYGITEYVVTEDKQNNEFWIDDGQQAVRKIVDTHWGPKSNPWCIIARDKDGTGTMHDAMENWDTYSDGPKRIVFENGKLIAMYANGQYWDRMDNDTDAPVIIKKKGSVTEKVELVPIGKGKVDEFVMERRTVSKDKKTVTTEYIAETEHYEAGATVVENRVNGITVKKTTSRPTFDKQGNDIMQVIEVVNFDKKGKATNNKNFEDGELIAINTYGKPFGEMKPEQIVKEKGDQIEFMGTNRFGRGDYFVEALIESKVTEIGFQLARGVKLESVIKTSPNGEIRLDLNKVLAEDPNTKGLSGIQFSKKVDIDLNQILEESMNVDAKKRFSATQAKLKGGKFKVRGVIPPSAQDFMGLLYNFVGKGKQGDQHLEILKKALVDPFARGIDQLNTARQNSSEDYRALLKQFPDVKAELNSKLKEYDVQDHIGDFTVDQAVRVYLWNKSGFDVPGLSARDLKALDSFVKNDPDALAFADGLGIISKKTEGYTKPGEYWLVENIASDLMSDGAIGDARSEFLTEWLENKNIIFSEENLNKIEVIYGSKFREALEDVLYRMETGKNRPQGSGRILNMYMNWVNNSVGAIMFFNIRSAVLQTISATNYINWSDNNPLKAAAAFANQKQFWSDFVMLFNSDYLKQRRSGNRRGVNEAELSAAVAGSENKVKAALAWLLKKGFTPTQIADSFAIASGGATFYRNRVKSLMKEGMSRADAETQAFLDFQETTEVSQQSARPDMISQQQANPLGRIILAFQNTPMQYGRIMNKAFRDLANGRGDAKTHVSKIVYYGAVQSIIFTALQSALFAVLGSDDDDEKEEMIDKKTTRMLNSMIDTWLTSIGYGGKAISTVKNTIMEYNKQRAKDVDEDFMTKSDHAYTLLQALSFSPPIGSKLRKIYQSIQTEKFNRDIMKERGLTLDNPAWGMIGNIIEGVTNIPLGRISNKMLNLDNALDSRNETWQRIAMLMGWNSWDLGIKDPDLVALGEDVKERKKQEKKMETEKKKFEKKREKLKEKYPGKTDEEIEVIVKSKELFNLSKQTQVDVLKALDFSDKEIKELKKEKDRTDKIAELYKDNNKLIEKTIEESKSKPKKEKEKKKEVKLSKSEKREKNLFKMKKKDQVNILIELGVKGHIISSLKYEKDRVEMIIKLQNKKSK